MAKIKLAPFTQPEPDPQVILPPRLVADIQRRINEIEHRFPGAVTNADRRELHKLKMLLHLAKSGGRND